jgi:hypothetical protein
MGVFFAQIMAKPAVLKVHSGGFAMSQLTSIASDLARSPGASQWNRNVATRAPAICAMRQERIADHKLQITHFAPKGQFIQKICPEGV